MEKKVNKKAVIKKRAVERPAVDEPVLELPAVAPKPKKAAKAKAKPAAKKPPKKAVKVEKVAVDPFAELAADAIPTKRKAAVRKKAVKAKPGTSPVAVAESQRNKPVKKAVVKEPTLDMTAEIAAAEPAVELSPVFKALAEVTLPELPRENRARLLMQSPTRAYFYWSLRDNPWKQLHSAFGEQGSYTLVLKLANLTAATEKLYPGAASGEWWFDVEPDTEYRAEIGFYAPNRPYFRIVHSNTVTTPRRSPSPHPASDARWTVSATKFAEVLDVSGFSRDAFDVAMAGEDADAASEATRSAYVKLTGSENGIDSVPAEDIRHALISIAAGSTLEELRHQTTTAFFASLQANADKLTVSGARSALGEYFDIDESEWTEYETGSAVFGASLVHFPKTLKTRNLTRRYSPLASHSVLS